MRGHGHDRARAVLDEHVVGDPDRDALAVHRVDDEAAGEDAVLLLRLALDGRVGRGVARVVEHLLLVLGPGDELGDQRVLGREHEERRAEERVGPRREDGEIDVELVDAEDHLGAFRAADPVPLHRQHAVGPRLEQVHLVEQLRPRTR